MLLLYVYSFYNLIAQQAATTDALTPAPMVHGAYTKAKEHEAGRDGHIHGGQICMQMFHDHISA